MKALPPTRFQNTLLPETAETDYAYGYGYTSATNESDWRDYWKILVKRRRLFVVVFLLVVCLGSYFSFTATNLYTATSVVKIEPQNPTVTSVAPINATDGSNDYYATQYALMKSHRLAAKVITELKLDSNHTFTENQLVHFSHFGSSDRSCEFIKAQSCKQTAGHSNTKDDVTIRYH